jgi:16S rRNA (cytidine1402-2'-O)-methyltransferase
MSQLYIVPCPIAEEKINSIPSSTIQVIHSLKHFVVERAKTARRFIKLTQPPYTIQETEVEEMDKHEEYKIPEHIHGWIKNKIPVGLLSEAGCPCIADPGFHVVRLFRDNGYKIVPLVGPSSLLLALMASGLNGQQFTFHGYLPIDEGKKKQAIRKIETSALKENYAQLVIETPYRNQKLFASFCKLLQNDTLLNISIAMTGEQEYSETKTIGQWKRSNMTFAKNPAVFIVGKK